MERKSKAYHISQEAIAICNGLDMDPSEAIVFLEGEVQRRAAYVDIKAAIREVMQVEGVILKKDEKERMERAFAYVIDEIKMGKQP